MVLGTLHSYAQENETGPHVTLHTKINSKWIKYLNVRADTKEFLEENRGENLLDINLGNNFLDLTSKAPAIKANINSGTTCS